jgi:hypothetical protein
VSIWHVGFVSRIPLLKSVLAVSVSCCYTPIHVHLLSRVDLLLMSFTCSFLSSEIESFHGPRRSIRLGMVFEEGQESPTPLAVPITVRNYTTPESGDPVLYHTRALTKTDFDLVQSERYAIVPESLPKLQTVLSWAGENMTAARGTSVQQLLVTTLKEFMVQYCKHEPRLPLVSLAVYSKILTNRG